MKLCSSSWRQSARQHNVLDCRLSSMHVGLAVKKLRSALVLGLVLWCAGAGCMLVSYAHGGAMNDVGRPRANGINWSGVAASAGVHSCCKARHASKHNSNYSANAEAETSGVFEQAALPEAPSPSGIMSCCPLTSGSMVLSSKEQANDKTESALASTGVAFGLIANVKPAPLATPLRLPNQNQTYLHCCVFLI